MDTPISGTIAIKVAQRRDGRYLCEVRPSSEIAEGATRRFHGQTATHAIANSLEYLARRMRAEAEAGQQLAWEAADPPPKASADKRFHVIVHYERLIDEESKFEAMHNTLLGNTVVENAEITVIQVDPDYPELGWGRRFKE